MTSLGISILSCMLSMPKLGKHTVPVIWIPYELSPLSMRVSTIDSGARVNDDSRFVSGYLIVAVPNPMEGEPEESMWQSRAFWMWTSEGGSGYGEGSDRRGPGYFPKAKEFVLEVTFPASRKETHRKVQMTWYQKKSSGYHQFDEEFDVEVPYIPGKLATRYPPYLGRFGPYEVRARFAGWEPRGPIVLATVRRLDPVTYPTSAYTDLEGGFDRSGGRVPMYIDATGKLTISGTLQTQRRHGNLSTGEALTGGASVYRDDTPFSFSMTPKP